tara:strand:+ start:463 stop:852 length:390 start_codon:yes stop_codon:yes gene_type:complete
MSNSFNLEIVINDMKLWSHVGLFDYERDHGQLFTLDITLWPEKVHATKTDKIKDTLDYSNAVREIHRLAFSINCFTIENFSEQILNLLEMIYGEIPMEIYLRKTSPPIDGFDGSVGVRTNRNFKKKYND